LLDSCPFLLEAIGASSSSSFLSQVHLKLFREFFPLITTTCLTPFEQLVKRGTNPLQETNSKRLHNHFFSNIIFDMSSDLHQAQLRSYARPGAWVWMFVHLVIPCFHFPLNVFSFALWTKLSLPHPLALSLTHCIYDQPLDPMGIHLFHYAHGGEKTTSHDVVQDAFISIVRYMAFHVWRDQTTFFCHLFFNIFVYVLTLFC